MMERIAGFSTAPIAIMAGGDRQLVLAFSDGLAILREGNLEYATRTRIDGAAVTPLIKDFEISPPPKELRDREPQLARKLTQIRFALDYATDVKPKVVSLRWSWFPEHPLYDVPDSPVAPMVVNAVVMRGSNTPDVLKFTTDAPGREIKFETPPTEVTRTSHPSSPNSSLLLLGGGLALMLLVFGSVVLPKRVRSGRT